jgi:hypothetical protein
MNRTKANLYLHAERDIKVMGPGRKVSWQSQPNALVTEVLFSCIIRYLRIRENGRLELTHGFSSAMFDVYDMQETIGCTLLG